MPKRQTLYALSESDVSFLKKFIRDTRSSRGGRGTSRPVPFKRRNIGASSKVYYARVTTAISAASYVQASPPEKAKIIPGEGQGTLYEWVDGELHDTEETVTIKTIADEGTPSGKHVMGLYDAEERVLFVEPCKGTY